VRECFHSIFPNLKNTPWSIKSPWNDSYKCIAWAACRTDVIWWPVDGDPQTYWPPGAPLDDSIHAFLQAFARLGYAPCDNPDFEFGYQKVAIYATSDGRVKHMARQHFLGRGWLSKCGSLEDILHANLQCIEGDPSRWEEALGRSYGQVKQILKRSWWTATVHRCLFRCFWEAAKFWLYRLMHPSWDMKRNRMP
jgi:hypothetical protein